MDALQWRGRARVVAYLDLILTGMSLLAVIVVAVAAGAVTAVASSPELANEIKKAQEGQRQHSTSWSVSVDPAAAKDMLVASAWILWVTVAISSILTGIQMWAAIKLMNATDLGTQLTEAFRKATIWRNVTVFFLIWSIILGIIMGSFICVILDIVLRGIFFVIVHNFMSEINSHLAMSSMPGPTMVSVKI